MLSIRDEQLRSLGLWAEAAFLRDLMAHLRAHFPDLCRQMGDEELSALCREEIMRARRYGIESQRDLCKYMSLVVVFGRDFDTLPWASETLRDPAVGPMLRLNRVFAEGIEQAAAAEKPADRPPAESAEGDGG